MFYNIIGRNMLSKVRKLRYKKIWAIAWPLIVANSFWNIQLAVDRIFLGHFSTEALAAAGLVSAVFWTPMALLQQTAAYVTAYISQHVGAKENKKIGAALWQGIYVSIFGGLIFLSLALVSPIFFSLIAHGPELTQLEIEYFNSLCFSALPTALVAAFSGFYSGIGKTKTILIINASGLIANVLFDYLLIFGNYGFPALGIKGAGYATAAAAFASALTGVFLIFNAKNNQDYRVLDSYKINFKMLKSFLYYGIPSGAQWALEGLAFTVFQIIVGWMPNGPVALASTSIAITIMMLVTLPSVGLAHGVMVLAGQLIGAKKYKRVVNITYAGIQMSLAYVFVFFMAYIFIPEFFINFFKGSGVNADWSEVLRITPVLLIFAGVFNISDGIYFNLSNVLKAAGDTKFISLVALTLPWPFMVLPAYLLLESHHGVEKAWGFAGIYVIIVTFVIWLRFHQGKWKNLKLT